MAAKRKSPTGRPRGRPRKHPKVEPKVEPQKAGEKKLIIKLNMKAKMKEDGASSLAPAPPVTSPRRDIPSDFAIHGGVEEIAHVQIEGNPYTGPFLGFENAQNKHGDGSLKALSHTVNAHQEGFLNDCINTFPELITTETLPTYHYFHSFGHTGVPASTDYDSEATISAQPTPEYDSRKNNAGKFTAKKECKSQAMISTDTMSESVYGNGNSSIGCDKAECDREARFPVKEKAEDGDGKDNGDKVVLTADFYDIQHAAQTGFYDWLDPALRDPYSCNFCVATFDFEDSKKRHELVYHTGGYYQCPACAMPFLHFWSLHVHGVQEHRVELPMQAPVQRVQHSPEMQQYQAIQYVEAEHIEEGLRRNYEANLIALHRQRAEWQR